MTWPLAGNRLPEVRTSVPAGEPHRGMLGRRGVKPGLALVIVALCGALAYFLVTSRTVAPSYRLGSVSRGPVTAAITASGTVNPVIMVQVGSQVSGQISELFADFNTPVTRGQVIARIDPTLFETRVAQARGDLAVAQAGIAVQQATISRARADLETSRAALAASQAQSRRAQVALLDAQRDYARKRRLYETGSAPEADRDRAQAAHDEAEAELRALAAQQDGQLAAVHAAEAQSAVAEANLVSTRAQVQQKEAALAGALVDLEHTYIRAPVDGTVILRNVDRGQTVAASLQAPVLFTIAQDLRAMQVDTSVDESDIGGVKPGQRVAFTVDAQPGRTFEGEVVQIRKAAQVVQNVVTYDVVVSAPNPEQLLLPGLTANVRIVTDHRDDALLVPNAALRYRPAGAGREIGAAPAPQSGAVWVAGSDGPLRRVPVHLGLTDGNVSEVVEGALAPGDRVVLGEAAPAGGPGPGGGPRF